VTGVRRAMVMAVVGIVCWGSLLWVMGLDVGHALVLAAALVALISLRHAPAINADENWPDEGDARSDVGARREVARLSWSMQGYESRVQRQSVRRLHEIAVFRLDVQGLDLDDPRDYLACQAALGERAYHVVSEPDGRPLYADFVTAVGAVERLGAGSTSNAGPVGSGPGRGNIR
jgi:hypothetical protein